MSIKKLSFWNTVNRILFLLLTPTFFSTELNTHYQHIIPVADYVDRKQGLVTNSECIQCGRCVDACKRDALKFRFVWNRRRYLVSKSI
jgi:ferredoxin